MTTTTRRAAVLVWGATLVVPFFFLALAGAVRGSGEDHTFGPLLFWMTVAVSVLHIVLSRTLPQRLGPFRAGPEATALARLLVGWAFCEAAALFPVVAWIVTGDVRLLAVFAIDLVALASLYPSEARLARMAAPGPARGP